MYTDLQTCATEIITHTQSLQESPRQDGLNASQLNYIERIQRNTLEFIDVYQRLQQMPLPEVIHILNHDVRNLITPIIGYAELLDMKIIGPLNDSQQATVRQLCDTCRRLHKQLDAVLDQMRQERETRQ